jgi:RNA-binding protein
MTTLKGSDRKKLRALAHDLNPVIHIGKQGVTETLLLEIDRALEIHELIKVKFVDFKDRKQELMEEVTKRTECQLAGSIGNIAILYRQNPDPEKRKVQL